MADAGSLIATRRADEPSSGVYLYAGLFAVAVAAFCLARWTGHRLGVVSDVAAVAGDATCGWSWLLVRALFQAPGARKTAWPTLLVLTLVAAGAFLRLCGDGATPLPRMVENLSGLISSALLLLAAIEPLKGLQRGMARGERGFRIVFAAGYATLLAVAVIWADAMAAGLGRWGAVVKPACALAALLGMALAVWYRHRHPLADARRGRRRAPVAEDAGLAAAVRGFMAQEAVYTLANLKVGDVARRLGEPEYKITQCVTGPLGFRNFNQMANDLRIEEAKRRLSDAAHGHLPILTIAYDCGFGSIGPFNRAFKARTGLTPMQFRKAGRPPEGAADGRS